MEENIIRAARINQAEATRQRAAQESARRRVADHYATHYGAEFAAQVLASDDFDF
ncbi:hypothetical protein ACPW96_21755 [Micromonospora sp. DT81.3]|uniref:hypothetical protein n=1 Tax=Micromonospora sp. DT81.3 TaxID=3416523 RepID=UPI003CEEFCED